MKNPDYHILLYDPDPETLDTYSYYLSCRAFQIQEASDLKSLEREVIRRVFPLFIFALRKDDKREREILELFTKKQDRGNLIFIVQQKEPDLILSLIRFRPFDILVEPITENILTVKALEAFKEITKVDIPEMVSGATEIGNRRAADRLGAETIYTAYDELFSRLIVIAEYRDNLTANHIKRVGYFSSLVAMHMGLSEELQDMLFYAAQLHDIGKLVVPEAILFKKGRLTKRETEIVRNHSLLGARLLAGSSSPILKMAEEIALSHHERWDGTGYPSGLSGEDIPLSARIVAIADVYDSLRAKRPYKRACSHAEACKIIKEGDRQTRPEHFDPQVLKTFLKLERSIERIYTESMSMPTTTQTQDLVSLLRRLFHE